MTYILHFRNPRLGEHTAVCVHLAWGSHLYMHLFRKGTVIRGRERRGDNERVTSAIRIIGGGNRNERFHRILHLYALIASGAFIIGFIHSIPANGVSSLVKQQFWRVRRIKQFRGTTFHAIIVTDVCGLGTIVRTSRTNECIRRVTTVLRVQCHIRRASECRSGTVDGLNFFIDSILLIAGIRNDVTEHIKSPRQRNIRKDRYGLIVCPGTRQFRGHSLLSTEDNRITFI